jgi:predicted RNA-binding protein YlxR (DUF448 family)
MGCGGRFAKSSLVRFTVQGVNGIPTLVIDPGGAAPGRGAYICPSKRCFERAMARKTILRRLGVTTIDPGAEEQFFEMLDNDR